MRVVLQPSKGTLHLQRPNYHLIYNEDGLPLTPTQRLSNVLRCADLLHLKTMAFGNLVRNVSIIYLRHLSTLT
jgi:hypothetical protein